MRPLNLTAPQKLHQPLLASIVFDGMGIPRLKDLMELLEEVAPAELAESWDNPGLQVGFLDQRIERLVLSLDPTPQAVQFAISRDAQLLLTHHPLIFKPVSAIKDGEYPGGVVYEAIKRGISIVALHTNLDAAHEGINAILADLLALDHVEPLSGAAGGEGAKGAGLNQGATATERKEARSSAIAGLGRIGDLDRPYRLSEFISRAKKALKLSTVRVVGEDRAVIERVAVVGGSGGSLIREAWMKGADLLVTGDVSYHQAREAEFLGLAVIDGGHFATETVAFQEFGKQLQKQFSARGWKVEVLFNEEEKDPLVTM